MANTRPELIRRAPRAFAGMARRHNDLAKAVRPLLNLSNGYGIVVTKSEGNVVVALRQV